MTRETKIGIAVACLFLCLAGAVYYLKTNEAPPGEASPPASLASAAATEEPHPVPAVVQAKAEDMPPKPSTSHSKGDGKSEPPPSPMPEMNFDHLPDPTVRKPKTSPFPELDGHSLA